MGRKPEGKAENLFKNLGKKIDHLIEDLKNEAHRPEIQSRYEELKRNADKLNDEFKHFKTEHKSTFDEIEKAFEKAGEEIRKTFKREKTQ